MKARLFVSVLILAITVCQASVGTSAVLPTATAASQATEDRDASRSISQRVDALLAQMTLDEKIGQMTQVERNSITPAEVAQFNIGSVLTGGDSLGDNKAVTWRKQVAAFVNAAQQSRLKIPLLFGADAVHGHAHLSDATIFPHNIGLGATRDAGLVERIGRATAQEMIATGIRWNFAPVVAAPQDIRWGRTYEGFSENTALVSEMGAAYVKGLQSAPASQTVMATAKHFLADGGTKIGTSKGSAMGKRFLLDQGDAQMDEATLRELFLPPYKAALDAGAKSVMVSFSSWNGTKMHGNKYLITDVLKGELGFKGFVVSDWQGIDQIHPDYYQAVVTAINAGVDMNMVPYDFKKFMSALKHAVEIGDVPQARIDDAVRRILTAKYELGLFEQPQHDTQAEASVGTVEHRALAREAVRKSLVLLENEDKTLPLNKQARVIFVAGQGADSTGYTSGGWTLEWQGTTENVGSGTTILDAVKQAVSPQTRVEYNSFGSFQNLKDAQGVPLRANVGIVVLAEEPYAEGVGDRANLELSDADLAVLARVGQVSDRVIVILVSGRPLVITDALPLSDAFVAAWLPGTEAQGITDVLFGDFEFSGKLPYTWPRSNSQLPFDFKHLRTAGCDAPLFPYGYGLTTRDASPEFLDCAK